MECVTCSSHGTGAPRNRYEAGLRLGHALADHPARFSLVVAVAPSGLPVAFNVAKVLRLPLDIIAVEKMTSPNYPGFVMGAVTADGVQVLCSDLVTGLKISDDLVQHESAHAVRRAQERERRWRRSLPRLDVQGERVLIVDDYITSGITARAAAECLRRRGAATVDVAAPLAFRPACGYIGRSANGVHCLALLPEMRAGSRRYAGILSVPDEDVWTLLNANRRMYARKALRTEREAVFAGHRGAR